MNKKVLLIAMIVTILVMIVGGFIALMTYHDLLFFIIVGTGLVVSISLEEKMEEAR